MKALSLWQPWASLLAFGEKKVETRSWTTKYRGPIAIHATAKETAVYGEWRGWEKFNQLLVEITERYRWGEGYWPDSHHRAGFGAVLAIANLVAIECTENVREDLSEQERIFGNYEDGRYAWFFENIERFDVPIPAKGNRMLWNWEETAQLRKAEQ